MSGLRVVGFAPDLMDGSKLRAAGVELARTIADTVAASRSADLVVLDLTRPGALEAIADIDAPTIGFGPHVEAELLAAAETAGCTEVLARSVLFKRLADRTLWDL